MAFMNRRNFFAQALSRSLGVLFSSRAFCSLTQRESVKCNRIVWSPVTKNVKGDPIEGVTYNVYRGLHADGSDGMRLNALPVSGQHYTDTDIEVDFIYYYAVAGVSMAGIEGEKSLIKVSGEKVY